MIKIWQIPRTDTRDRCGRCLKAFVIRRKKSLSYYSKELKGSRFPRVCYNCKNGTE